MRYEEVFEMLSELEIPVAYNSFDVSSYDVEPPFCVFYYPSSDNFAADDKVYSKIENVSIELYTNEKDFDLEQQIETIFDEHLIVYEKTEMYIEQERMFETLYTTQIIVNA